MSTLNEYYKNLNIHTFEGHSQQCKPETEFLKNIVDNPDIINIMEIGLTQDIQQKHFYLQIKISI